jgi:transposase
MAAVGEIEARFPMKKEERLDRKINRLFRQAGYPKHLNSKGSKKFASWLLCLGWVAKQVYRLSYRRAMRFLDEHFDIKLHWTTLQKFAKRMPKSLWQVLFAATCSSDTIPIAAGDGTGFSRSGPSSYFLKRIDRDGPVGRPVQAVCLVDVRKRKFASCQINARPRHEAKFIPRLHRQARKIQVLLLDKAFDKEDLHLWLEENGTFCLAPVRKGCRRGRHRKLIKDCMDWWLYWQRNIVESLFSALKRLFGSDLKCRSIKTQSAEIFCRLIAYNLGYFV